MGITILSVAHKNTKQMIKILFIISLLCYGHIRAAEIDPKVSEILEKTTGFSDRAIRNRMVDQVNAKRGNSELTIADDLSFLKPLCDLIAGENVDAIKASLDYFESNNYTESFTLLAKYAIAIGHDNNGEIKDKLDKIQSDTSKEKRIVWPKGTNTKETAKDEDIEERICNMIIGNEPLEAYTGPLCFPGVSFGMSLDQVKKNLSAYSVIQEGDTSVYYLQTNGTNIGNFWIDENFGLFAISKKERFTYLNEIEERILKDFGKFKDEDDYFIITNRRSGNERVGRHYLYDSKNVFGHLNMVLPTNLWVKSDVL